VERAKATRLIKVITLVWFIMGLILAALILGRLITLDLFQILFPAGFIIWAVLVTILTRYTSAKS